MQRVTMVFSDDMAVLARAFRLGLVSLVAAGLTASLVIAAGGRLAARGPASSTPALITVAAR